jgi:hypothetical protein
MKLLNSRAVWGGLLILVGLLLLLENFTSLRISSLFVAILFGFVGVAFLSTYLQNRANWWMLLPGVILLALGVMIALDDLAPGLSDIVGGAFFLGSISLAFCLVYLTNRSQWWAIIPAGVMLTLAIIAGLDGLFREADLGGLFFVGIGLTFALLGLLPNQGTNLRWAFIPAGILLVFGLLISTATAGLINYVWPVLFILAGLFLLLRNVVLRRNE